MRRHLESSCPGLAAVEDVTDCCLYSCDLFCFEKPPYVLPSSFREGVPFFLEVTPPSVFLIPRPLTFSRVLMSVRMWRTVATRFGVLFQAACFIPVTPDSHNSPAEEGLLSLITSHPPCSSVHFLSGPPPHSLGFLWNNRSYIH